MQHTLKCVQIGFGPRAPAHGQNPHLPRQLHQSLFHRFQVVAFFFEYLTQEELPCKVATLDSPTRGSTAQLSAPSWSSPHTTGTSLRLQQQQRQSQTQLRHRTAVLLLPPATSFLLMQCRESRGPRGHNRCTGRNRHMGHAGFLLSLPLSLQLSIPLQTTSRINGREAFKQVPHSYHYRFCTLSIKRRCVERRRACELPHDGHGSPVH